MGLWKSLADILFDPLPEYEEPAEERQVISLSDPALAEWLGLSTEGSLLVTEQSALSNPALYRAVNIVAGTIAGLPLKTYRDKGTIRERTPSLFDNPCNPYPITPFAWTETIMLHLLLHGEAFLLHIRNNAGSLIGLFPIHPLQVSKVEWSGTEKLFHVQDEDGRTHVYTSLEMTHITGNTLDVTRGISPLSIFRTSIKAGLAANNASTRSFTNGLMIGGIVTPEQDVTEDDAKIIKAGISNKISGPNNAGDIAVINRSLKFTPWTMNHVDAQFIESREFQVDEYARIYGVPPHLLAAKDASTWGAGIAEQNLALARHTLMPWTKRIEQALSALLPRGTFVEFDYSGILQGSPAEEIRLLLEQVAGGLLSIDEARAIRNLPPLPKEEVKEEEQDNEQEEGV